MATPVLLIACIVTLATLSFGHPCKFGNQDLGESVQNPNLSFCCWFRQETCCQAGVDTYDLALRLYNAGIAANLQFDDCFLDLMNYSCLRCSPHLARFMTRVSEHNFYISLCPNWCSKLYDNCRPYLQTMFSSGMLHRFPSTARGFCEDLFTRIPDVPKEAGLGVKKPDTIQGHISAFDDDACYRGLSPQKIKCSGCVRTIWPKANVTDCGAPYCELTAGNKCPVRAYPELDFDEDVKPAKPSPVPKTPAAPPKKHPSKDKGGGSSSSGMSIGALAAVSAVAFFVVLAVGALVFAVIYRRHYGQWPLSLNTMTRRRYEVVSTEATHTLGDEDFGLTNADDFENERFN
mmetsp:Transcript_23025/g.57691  ORF Transcript_23025/g.57691 Transcript_23025/m.57691 type:complete len:347 (+) Transcript_23025:126-1166(+)|eukprot:CAMPEP_0177672754 /NCGR_PEP_ID=MMETSP0447-20121125/25526_1 /TAXON_ID=0 /ORGANISM="Stygamoeba regulata, Strain BSH-02190019" /LENGTH=346 /DNA_ID=CAMNT_0019180475 /DNA_START=75 /DNA_END=1115 /DNA_ORIENTATION=+